MANSNRIPTFEEYRETVKERLRLLLKNLSEPELEKYLKTEDAIDEIKIQYEQDRRRYSAGEISHEAFTKSGAATVAQNLFMLY